MRKKRTKKPRQRRSTRKHGSSLKNLARNARVAQRIVTGESQREAAKNEGISRSVVQRILSREEFRAIQAEGRSDVVRLVHKAAQGLEHHLKKKDLTACLETLKGTQILMPRTQTEISLSQPAEYTEFGYAAYAKKGNEELEFAVRFRRWPSEAEVEVKKDTGYWPQELTDGEKQQ
jgi:transposase